MTLDLTIYLARSISGYSYDEVVGYYESLSNELKTSGYRVICPMTGKEYLRNEVEFKAHGYAEHPISTNHAIVTRDYWSVTKADVVLFDFSTCPEKISIGMVGELSWAYAYQKHIISVLPEGNVHHHAFVLDQTNIVFPSLGSAVDYLKKFIAQEISLGPRMVTLGIEKTAA